MLYLTKENKGNNDHQNILFIVEEYFVTIEKSDNYSI